MQQDRAGPAFLIMPSHVLVDPTLPPPDRLPGAKARALPVSIFHECEHVTPVLLTEGGKPPGIEPQAGRVGQRGYELSIASVVFSNGQFLEEAGQT
jgi:hypothetical protein